MLLPQHLSHSQQAERVDCLCLLQGVEESTEPEQQQWVRAALVSQDDKTTYASATMHLSHPRPGRRTTPRCRRLRQTPMRSSASPSRCARLIVCTLAIHISTRTPPQYQGARCSHAECMSRPSKPSDLGHGNYEHSNSYLHAVTLDMLSVEWNRHVDLVFVACSSCRVLGSSS